MWKPAGLCRTTFAGWIVSKDKENSSPHTKGVLMSMVHQSLKGSKYF